MALTIKDMMAVANAAAPPISADEARALIAGGGVLIVDVREPPELKATGKLKGAIHVPRGLLEFNVDPASPIYNEAFKPDVPVLLYCGTGGRSALAGKTLVDMGFATVRNLGGISSLIEAGFETEPG